MAQPDETTPTDTTDTTDSSAEVAVAQEPLAVDALVEDVSIDGMCGVY